LCKEQIKFNLKQYNRNFTKR